MWEQWQWELTRHLHGFMEKNLSGKKNMNKIIFPMSPWPIFLLYNNTNNPTDHRLRQFPVLFTRACVNIIGICANHILSWGELVAYALCSVFSETSPTGGATCVKALTRLLFISSEGPDSRHGALQHHVSYWINRSRRQEGPRRCLHTVHMSARTHSKGIQSNFIQTLNHVLRRNQFFFVAWRNH